MALLIDTNIKTDFIGEDLKLLNDSFDGVLANIASSLDVVINRIVNNNNYSLQSFYNDPRVGTNGIKILQEMGFWKEILNTKAPEKITENIANAGQNLTVNNDGSVTVNV